MAHEPEGIVELAWPVLTRRDLVETRDHEPGRHQDRPSQSHQTAMPRDAGRDMMLVSSANRCEQPIPAVGDVFDNIAYQYQGETRSNHDEPNRNSCNDFFHEQPLKS